MKDNSKDSILKNIKRLLMFKSLNKIQGIVDDTEKQEKRNKIQAAVFIILGILVLSYILYFYSSYETGKRHKKTDIGLIENNIQASTNVLSNTLNRV